MVYPSKTDAPRIAEAALTLLEEAGEAALSTRALAGRLGVTPNALYRYFPSREALLAAVAERGARLLLDTITTKAAGLAPDAAIRATAGAYLAFARERPALYATAIAPRPATSGADTRAIGEDSAHAALWHAVVRLMADIAGPAQAAEAAVTLWAFLHGVVELERGGMLGGVKPDPARFGLEVLIAGIRSAGASLSAR